MQRFKISTVVASARVGEVLAALTTLNLSYTVNPVAEAAAQININKAGPAPRKIKARSKRSRDTTPTAQTRLGKVILSAFKPGTLVRLTDAAPVAKDAGFNPNSVSPTFHKLVKEGAIVRQSHGLYRLLTTKESLQHQQAQDPSFTG